MVHTMPVTIARFDDVLARVEDGLGRLVLLVRRIIDNFKRSMTLLGAVAVGASRVLEALERIVQKILVEVGRLLAEPGHPVALWVNGTRWSTEVGAHAGNRVGTFTADFMHGDDRWKGPAADAYVNTLPPQKAALEKTQAVSNQIGESLHEVALAVVTFWLALAVALTTLVGELLGACAATATGVGAPAGVAAATAAAAKFTAAVASIAAGTMAFLAIALGSQGELDRELADNAPFAGPPAGHWPASTTVNLADGRMSDGDDSDWRLGR